MPPLAGPGLHPALAHQVRVVLPRLIFRDATPPPARQSPRASLLGLVGHEKNPCNRSRLAGRLFKSRWKVSAAAGLPHAGGQRAVSAVSPGP